MYYQLPRICKKFILLALQWQTNLQLSQPYSKLLSERCKSCLSETGIFHLKINEHKKLYTKQRQKLWILACTNLCNKAITIIVQYKDCFDNIHRRFLWDIQNIIIITTIVLYYANIVKWVNRAKTLYNRVPKCPVFYGSSRISAPSPASHNAATWETKSTAFH